MSTSVSCTYPSESCPVEATAYGYAPNYASSIFFTTLFGLIFVIQIAIVSFPPRTNRTPRRHWPFSAFALLGSCLSFLGFLSRIWLRADVWFQPAIAVELITNLLAPAFLVGATYLTIKPVILHFGAEHSRLSPDGYLWIFLSCDAVYVILMTVGGGVATAKGPRHESSIGSTGGYVVLAGATFQIVSMLVLCGLMIDYFLRQHGIQQANPIGHATAGDADADSLSKKQFLPSGGKMRAFMTLMSLSFIFVLIRCIYRVAEFSNGWGNSIMRNEAAFLVLEGVMVALAWICVTTAHPAFLFPAMCLRNGRNLTV